MGTQTPPNWSETPFVTVQLMCHSGDVHLLPRAVASVLDQDLDHTQIELQLVFDGNPTEKENAIIDDALLGHDFAMANLWHDKKNGYYCVPRQRCTPMINGLYVAFMDCDNEMAPGHLSGLLAAIREAHPTQGWPHFVYSRREYVSDMKEGEPPVLGPSDLTPWEQERVSKLMLTPTNNFVDTGDMLIGKSTLFELAEMSGCIWNRQCRRFGDWDLVMRMASVGFRGRAVDQVTNIYHWTGDNLQLTRAVSEVSFIPESVFEKLKAEGKMKA